MSDRAPVFEEAGYFLFGPLALNLAALDEGNVHMLAHIASDSQKQQFLAPFARGGVGAAFAMTEPAPGAGSDPAALGAGVVKVAGGWRVSGRRWFITGADGARHSRSTAASSRTGHSSAPASRSASTPSGSKATGENTVEPYAGSGALADDEDEALPRQNVVVEFGGRCVEVSLPGQFSLGNGGAASGGTVIAPMKGTVVKVAVTEGQEVAEGASSLSSRP